MCSSATALHALRKSRLRGGETVAVFGCGPVGIMAQKAAWLQGAARVIGVDLLDYRLATARRAANAETVNATDQDAVEIIREFTDGRGADVCVDAVGLEAERSLLEKLANIVQFERGTMKVLSTCVDAVRRGGTVTVVGVYGTDFDNFPLGQIFDKGIAMRFGQAPVQKYIDQLMELTLTGKVRLDDVISHRLPLSEAPHGYDIFNKKEDDCVKVVLKP
jgi:alcohol dehydrogenase